MVQQVSGSPQQLHSAAFAVLDAATRGLDALPGDGGPRDLAGLRLTVGQTVRAADVELRILGSRDRARVAARLAVSCAQLRRALLEFLPPADVDALLGRDLQTLDGLLTADRG